MGPITHLASLQTEEDVRDDTGKGDKDAETRLRVRVKLKDVAERAGVGIATVDRVLNERGSVSPEITRRVIEAARELRLPRSLPVPYRRGLRLDVILTRPDTPFFERLNQAFIRAAATLDRSVIVQRSFVDESDAQHVAERILATRCQALIVYGQENLAVIEAVASVTSAGVPVVTIVSDLPTSPRLAYVGINHHSAGRTAAYFMARMARSAGSVIAIGHSFRYRAHADRISGFREGLADYASDLAISDMLEGHDDQGLTERLLTDAFRRSANIVGIYNAGGANRAIERALNASGLAGKAVFIGHELTIHTARMLATGVMTVSIDQNPEEQARRAIDVLLQRFGYGEPLITPGEVPFTIYGPENLPKVDHASLSRGEAAPG
jgi:LacI family transcriptional regulator